MHYKIPTNLLNKFKRNQNKKTGEILSGKPPKNVKYNGLMIVKKSKKTKLLKPSGNKLEVIKLTKKLKRKNLKKFRRKK